MDITKITEPNIFLTADHHFGHRNIIKYEKRPFENVKQMDEVLINNWNSVISKDDIVIHLGDFALASTKYTNRYLEQLNGCKILVYGNHDRKRQQTKGWKVVTSCMYINEPDYKILLLHNPRNWKEYLRYFVPHYSEINYVFHGHIHSRLLETCTYFDTLIRPFKLFGIHFVNVGVDVQSLMPIPLEFPNPIKLNNIKYYDNYKVRSVWS